jgi:hypothetical protein
VKGKEWQGFSLEMAVGCGGSAKNCDEQRTLAFNGGRVITGGEDKLSTVQF